MRRQIALAAVFVSVVFASRLPARQSPAPQQQPPVFRSGAAFVRVDLYPTKDGRIVPGLSQNDFQIFEDGKPQKIETFDYVEFPTFASEAERRDPVNKEEGDALAADPRNRVFVVYLDTFHVSIPEARRSRLPLIAMLDRTIGPSDVFGVLTPSETYANLVFGRKVKGTEEMLTRHWAWGDSNQEFTKDPEDLLLARCYDDIMPKEDVAKLIAREREDRSLRRLRELVDYLGRLREERKNLLIFSHGWDLEGPAQYLMTAIDHAPHIDKPTVSLGGKLRLGDQSRGEISQSTCEADRTRLANEDFEIRFRELLDAAKRANVSFYPVNPAGLDPDVSVTETYQRQAVRETAVDRLRELAINTDGMAVVDTNDLRTAMMKITDSLSAYYLIGYYPTNTKQDGSVRSITVKGPPGLDLRARRQYRAADEKDEAARRLAAVPAGSRATPRSTAEAEIDAALTDLVRATAGRADVSGRAVMVNRAEIAVVAESAQPVTTDTDIQIVINDSDGNAVASGRGRITAGARAAALRIAMPSGSRGPWQAVMRVSGGDARGGEVWPLALPAGPVGDPELLRIDAGGASPVARPVFSRRERMRAVWTSLDAGEMNQPQARLLDRRGQPLAVDAVVTLAPRGARTAASVDVVLAPLAPGDYVLELTMAAGGSTSRRLVAFRVTQ
jgi:VWFA-related protein